MWNTLCIHDGRETIRKMWCLHWHHAAQIIQRTSPSTVCIIIGHYYIFPLHYNCKILTFNRFNGEEANNPIFLPVVWKEYFPNLDLQSVNLFFYGHLAVDNNNYYTRWIVDGLQFQMDGNFVNLACINPSELVAVKSGAKGHHICSSGGASDSASTSLVCISLIKVTSCHIANPITN